MIADPPKFSDGKELSFTHWVTLMASKMEFNADHFRRETLRMTYVLNRTEGLALSHLEPRSRKKSPKPWKTADEMIEYPERVFGDPHRKHNSGHKFRALIQGGKSFDTFGAKFQRLSIEMNRDGETQVEDLISKLSYSTNYAKL